MSRYLLHTGDGSSEGAPERIVVVRALQGIGDLLCAVPAFRTLRAAWPKAHITLLGLPWAQAIVDRFSHYLDDFIAFPGFPGIPERAPNVRRLPAFLARIHAHPFDLALQMHGSGIISNPFTALLNARRTAGFFLPGQYRPNEQLFSPYPAHKPEIRRWLHLMAELGLPLQGEDLEFPIRVEEQREFEGIKERYGLRSGSYICVHPGAREAARRWPAEQFAAVADVLAAEGLQVVLTGTQEEASITRGVMQKMQARPIDLTGRTSLGAAAALLREARLLICNDTGLSHFAVAVDTPSVVIFLASDLNRWAPLNRERHRPVEQPTVEEVLVQTEELIETVYAT